MNAPSKLVFASCSFALSVTLVTANSALSQESFRLSRPSATQISKPPQSNIKLIPETPLKATATVNTEDTPPPKYHNPIFDWERKHLAMIPVEPELEPFPAAPAPPVPPPQMQMAPPPPHHHGLKAHLGMAVIGLGAIAGSAAGAYMGVTPVHHMSAAAMAQSTPLQPPPVVNFDSQITVTTGHCPAAFDPEFQVPVRWWDTLSKEENDPEMGGHWKFWLLAVQNVFKAHARELRGAVGSASVHVMVNPDGTIYNVTPYTGAESINRDNASNGRTMGAMENIVAVVGDFPPFPEGSKLRCYHLVFSATANQ